MRAMAPVMCRKLSTRVVLFNSAFDTLRETFGKSVAPLVVPIWDENKRVTGVVDVLHKRAFEPAGNKRKEIYSTGATAAEMEICRLVSSGS